MWVCVCVRAGMPSSDWAQPFNVSQSGLVRATRDANKTSSLRLLTFSRPLCALCCPTSTTPNHWHSGALCRASGFTVLHWLTTRWHHLRLPLLRSRWHVVGSRVVLLPTKRWRFIFCPWTFSILTWDALIPTLVSSSIQVLTTCRSRDWKLHYNHNYNQLLRVLCFSCSFSFRFFFFKCDFGEEALLTFC